MLRLLKQMGMIDRPRKPKKVVNPSDPHAFWDTQPVPRLSKPVSEILFAPCFYAVEWLRFTPASGPLPSLFFFFTAESTGDSEAADGPIDRDLTPAEVRQEPYAMPAGYEWSDVNMHDAKDVRFLCVLLLIYCAAPRALIDVRSAPRHPTCICCSRKTMLKMMIICFGLTILSIF